MRCLCGMCSEKTIDCPCGARIFDSDHCYTCGRPKWSMLDEQKRRESEANRTGGGVD